MAVGNRANLEGINLIGMRRRNFSKSEIDEVKKVYSILFNANDLEFKNKINKLKKEKFSSDPAKIITDFVNVETNRAYVSPTEI